jgi:tetratricopeptide (TPR) repeat protein
VRELADELPDSAETVALGLEARIALLNYGWRLGMSHEEAQAVFGEAERMAAKAGDARARTLLLSSYGGVLGTSQGDLGEWVKLTRQAIALAEESGDPALYLTITNLSYSLYCTGDYREGLAVCDRGIELADGDPSVGGGVVITCPYAWCLGWKGYLLGELGELEEGRRLIEQGREIARDQGDIEVVGWSHLWSTWLAVYRGEPETALGHAQQALEIAERMGGSFSRAWAWYFLGFAERVRGEWQRAIEALDRSVAIARDGRSAAEGEAMRLAVLSECHLGLGELERARHLSEEGVAVAHAQDSPPREIYASLALARVLLGSSGTAARAEIETALARALELVRATGSKGSEPLVHVELAELARQSGDEEGRERELREAHRLFKENGATGHVERLSTGLLPTA